MTERFRQEYIDFVTKSEPIQAAWQKRGLRLGDWIYRAVYEDLRMIVKIEKPNVHDIAAYLDNGKRLYRRHVKKPELIAWLPTLSDLLDMLVDQYRRTVCSDMLICGEGATLGKLRDKIFNDYHKGSYNGGDLELAAARPLERVLEKENEK